MAKDKGKSEKDTTPAKSETPEVEHVCANCNYCDKRNCGFCENENVRKLLSMWDGIIIDVNMFGCVQWKEKTDGKRD